MYSKTLCVSFQKSHRKLEFIQGNVFNLVCSVWLGVSTDVHQLRKIVQTVVA